jgi:hypothetical protein
MEAPPPTALSSLIQRGIKSQRRQLHEHVILRGERFVCLQCEEEHTPHPGWAGPALHHDNVLGHFKTKHKNVTIYTSQQFENARKRLLEHLQPTISSKFPKVECFKGVDQAVQLLRRHPGTPLSNFDSSDFLRPWADSKGVNRKAVSRAVVIADDEQFARLKILCERKLIGGQADGGKDVLSDKLIGQAVVIKDRFYCWNILKPPAGTYYNAEFYKEVFEEFVDDVEACDALMCGLTVDNEASLNSGIALMLTNAEYQHLIHNRCTNHSAELLLSDVQGHIPLLQTCTAACHDIVTVVRNTKAFKDALRKSQLDSNIPRPMRLIKPANTRKWSTSFLMLSRVQQLYAHLARLEDCFALNEVPAQRVWRETWAPRLREQVSPVVLSACVRMLYWIFVGEQILQRDSSSVIHSAFVFENICAIMRNRNVPEIQRISPMLLANANVQAIQEAVDSRRELVASSKIYSLAIAMWPVTDNQVIDQVQANAELDAYICKCWKKWQEKQHVFGAAMPLEYRVQNIQDETEMSDKREAFLQAAGIQMTAHLLADPGSRIANAKTAFTRTSSAIFDSLTAELDVPKVQRGTILADRFKLREYWMSVWSEVPALFMVFLTLNSVCATEAGCERIFSKEGFIHNDNRNRLGHDLVVALMRNAVNADDFNGILNSQHMWDFDGFWHAFDEEDEDAAEE